LKEEIGTH